MKMNNRSFTAAHGDTHPAGGANERPSDALSGLPERSLPALSDEPESAPSLPASGCSGTGSHAFLSGKSHTNNILQADIASSCGTDPVVASDAPCTRREAIRRIAVPLIPLYGEREARQIALTVTSELSKLTPAALLADPTAPLMLPELELTATELATGRPMQYVLGSTEFCGMRINVREGVLIPRPETEELAMWIAQTTPEARRILDVGTGSGCIALALKHLLPKAEVCAADISAEALVIARENAAALGLDVRFEHADALREASGSMVLGNKTALSADGIESARLLNSTPASPASGRQFNRTNAYAPQPVTIRAADASGFPFGAEPSNGAKGSTPDPQSVVGYRSSMIYSSLKECSRVVAASESGSSSDNHLPTAPALAEAFGGTFDVIVSNPPYIPLHERNEMHRNVTEHEPASALFVPDEDPLLFYRAIARAARRMLAPNGRLYFEINERLATQTRSLLADEGFTESELRTDFNDKPRMLCVKLNG